MFGFLKKDQEASTEAVQAEFIERVANAAREFVHAAQPETGQLDYSLSSIHALDAVLEAAHLGNLPLTPMQTVGAAAYLYEVARREYGGLYEVCDDEDPVVLVTGGPDAEVCLGAIAKVERRIRYGSDEAVPPFFERFKRAVEEQTAETIR